jgi:hypothetical protein
MFENTTAQDEGDLHHVVLRIERALERAQDEGQIDAALDLAEIGLWVIWLSTFALMFERFTIKFTYAKAQLSAKAGLATQALELYADIVGCPGASLWEKRLAHYEIGVLLEEADQGVSDVGVVSFDSDRKAG